jgi:hypothetical protein
MRLLQKTSFLIFIPSIVSIIYEEWLDAIISTLLCATSIYNHTTYTRTALYLDRIMIFVYSTRLIQIAYSRYITQLILLFGYIYLFYSYIYGYYNKCGSFHRNCSKADRYHAVNHILTALIPSIFIIWNGGTIVIEKIENTV